MPLVRISLAEGRSEAQLQAISDGVQRAMISAMNVPQDDLFQIIAEHAPRRMVVHKTYLGVSRSDDALIISITLARGRTEEMKKELYKQIADNLQVGAGVRREDVMVVLTENGPGDWTFGNGEAQMLNPDMTPHWNSSGKTLGQSE